MKNRNFRRTFSLFLAVILIFFSMPIVNAVEDEIIRNDESGIPDTNLYNALLKNADTNEDGILTVEEAESVENISVSYEKISSLKGLKFFKNIKSFYAAYCDLITLDGLEGLPKLYWLDVHCNQLTNIDNVANFPNLMTICAWDNKISKLPDLRNFTKLKLIGKFPTDFSYNKLSRAEMMNKLPSYLLEDQSYYLRPNIDVWMETQNPDPEDLELVDNDTGIELTGLIHPDAVLNVKNTENTLENAVKTFDITLEKDGNIIQPSGEITISIPCEYSDCDVFWVKDDGTKVDMNAEYVDGKYVFKTDHLSVYSLVRESKPTDPIPGITEFTDSATGICVSGYINADLMKVEKVDNVAIDGCKQSYEISFEELKGDILGELEFKFPVVDESLSICHISPDGKITEIISTYQNGNLTFKFDAIGTFVLYEKDSNIMGDIDLDGKTDIKDVTLIQKWIIKIVKFNEVQKKNADFNSDGMINIKDATAIQKSIAS